MRTFHVGGVAGDDITTGLPRVTELFEARVPKGKAPIADVDGRIAIEDGERFWKITLTPDDGGEEIVYDKLSKRQWLATHVVDGTERALQDGDHVHVGQLLLEGTADPHEVLRVMGPREVQLHLVREVQKVYRTQSVDIHDKHIEVIIRQMLRRVTIIDSGSTEFLPGALAERADFETQNRRVVAEGGEPASGRPVLMGITKASLATESWLSAASFQETTRILTDAAINGKRDKLVGLKENVIIGKLIPAGTGMAAGTATSRSSPPRRPARPPTRCRATTTATTAPTCSARAQAPPCRWTTTTSAATRCGRAALCVHQPAPARTRFDPPSAGRVLLCLALDLVGPICVPDAAAPRRGGRWTPGPRREVPDLRAQPMGCDTPDLGGGRLQTDRSRASTISSTT